MNLILQVFYTLFSSLLLSLAIPNELLKFGSPFIAFVAIIPYYMAVKRSKNFWIAFLLGFIQTCTTHLLSSYWLAFFKDFAALTLGASAFGTGCIGALFGALFYLPYYTEKRRNPLNVTSANEIHLIPKRIFWFAAVYTSYEWVKSSGFLGYPWGTISSCMFRARIFMQLSAITGTYGITFLTVFFSALIGEGIELYFKVPNLPAKKRLIDSYRTCAFVWVVFFSLSMFYGLIEYKKTRIPIKQLTTILVQQNEDPWLDGSDRQSILLSQSLTNSRLEELKENDKKADLIVWSEGCLKSAFPDANTKYSNYPKEKPLFEFIRENQTPLLAGGSFRKKFKSSSPEYYNAAIVFDKNANFRGWYGKNHLVPFAEAIPFMEYPPVRDFMDKVIGISAGWTPGNQYTFFDIPCQWYDKPLVETVKNINLNQEFYQQKIEDELPPVTRISTPICYDDAFTDIMRPLWKNGSEVFMNITDDSWSLKKSAEIQHFVIASYRSIEYRTTLVRSTNAGLTAVLDPAGKILCELPLFEAASVTCDIPVYKRKTTTYARFGNWLPFILNIFLLFSFIFEITGFEETEYVFPEKKILLRKKRAKKTEKKENKKSDKKSENKSKKTAKSDKKSDKKKMSVKKTEKKSDKKTSKKDSKKSKKK